MAGTRQLEGSQGMEAAAPRQKDGLTPASLEDAVFTDSSQAVKLLDFPNVF